jgi:hypothetical protein
VLQEQNRFDVSEVNHILITSITPEAGEDPRLPVANQQLAFELYSGETICLNEFSNRSLSDLTYVRDRFERLLVSVGGGIGLDRMS